MKRLLFLLWNLWPPFWGAGIAIDTLSPDLKFVRMRLKRRPWTRNIAGTQFGGSIYAMTDPIYMVMLLNQLGRDYIVWDKAATIRFRKPGRTDLFAEFAITDEDVAAIKATLTSEAKLDWQRAVQVKDKHGELIAEIDKVIHVRRKDRRRL